MGEVKALVAADGMAPQVGYWFASLQSLRAALVAGVEDLSTETLARRAYAGANTIGTLLVHIAEAELFWMQEVLRGEALSRQQREEYRFDVFGRPGAAQVEARDFGFFRAKLDHVHDLTRRTLVAISDADLDTVRTWKDARDGAEHQFSVRWVLNHVFEHEAHHRGQIFLLKAALGR